MVDISKIQIIVMAHRQPPCALLLRWLQVLPGVVRPWLRSSQDYGTDLCRNQGIQRFLRECVPSGATHLVMIDHDIVPLTTDILTAEGELAWLGHAGQQGTKGHYGGDDFGAGCFRASADLLQRMPPPWFKTTYNPEITRRLRCHCGFFASHASVAGVVPKMVGVAGHQQGGDTGPVLLPAPETKCGWQLLWPSQL